MIIFVKDRGFGLKNLTVVSVINGNSGGILPLMIDSLETFSGETPKVLLCNTNQAYLCPYASKTIGVFNYCPKMKGGSNIHGESLNYILKKVKTLRVAIIEPDCVMLSNDWARCDKDFKLIKKGKHLWHVCFLIGPTKDLQKVDFRPGTEKTRANGKSYRPQEDVGWDLCSGIGVKTIDQIDSVDCKTGKGKLFGPGFQSDEIWAHGKLIAAHFGRGSNLDGKANRKGFSSNKKQLEEWKKIVSDILICENNK